MSVEAALVIKKAAALSKRGAGEITAQIREPYPPHQTRFVESTAKRNVIRAGRRGGKTVGIAIYALRRFLQGKRILYAAPTYDQVSTFWEEVKRALLEPVSYGQLYKNETKHIIERPNSTQRIKAKTAWDADSLRGDWADVLILDEFQLMHEDAWNRVGAPMLLDSDGDAVFIYTPPSMESIVKSKAKDPKHAAKLFKKAEQLEQAAREHNTISRWQTHTFSSHDNPHLEEAALKEISEDMTELAYKQEILALDLEDDPRALWNTAQIAGARVDPHEIPNMDRIVVGVDPSGGAAEIGIVVAGVADQVGYLLADLTVLGSPHTWGSMVVAAYEEWQADRIVAEKNYGGDMVKHTIRSVEGGQHVSYKDVHAARGKAIRAEPIAAKTERGLVKFAGDFPKLEGELTSYVPGVGMASPNRLDAFVWAFTELLLHPKRIAPQQQEFIR